MATYAAVVVGGPCAGECHIRPERHLAVAVMPPPGPLSAYDPNVGETPVEIPAQRFEYRYTQLAGHALWVPHDWTLEQAMSELLSHYQLQAGVKARRG